MNLSLNYISPVVLEYMQQNENTRSQQLGQKEREINETQMEFKVKSSVFFKDSILYIANPETLLIKPQKQKTYTVGYKNQFLFYIGKEEAKLYENINIYD